MSLWGNYHLLARCSYRGLWNKEALYECVLKKPFGTDIAVEDTRKIAIATLREKGWLMSKDGQAVVCPNCKATGRSLRTARIYLSSQPVSTP